MDSLDEIPLGLRHLLKALVADNAGIVDEHVDGRPKGSLAVANDGLSVVRHRVDRGNGLTASYYPIERGRT